jgi:outer membrane protein assembly factor BamB
MQDKKTYIIITLLSLSLSQCSDPVSSIDKHFEKLWELPLSEVSNSGIIISDNSLIFKTQVNLAGQLYKVSKDGKNVQTASIGGCTHGIPVVQDNIIYHNNCVYSLHALNVNDLSVIWSKTDFTWIPIPAVDENYVYVTDMDEVSALNKTTGSTVWTNNIIGKNSVNPVIDSTVLYFATGSIFQDGYLYSVNKDSGTINYQITIPYIEQKSQFGGSLGGVSVWNDRIFVPGDNWIFYCFKKSTGELMWSFEADAPMEVTPRVSDDKVYFGTLNRTCYALDVYTGSLIWSYQGGGSISAEPSFYQNYVMFKASGALLILDKNSGNEFLKMSGTTTDYGFMNAVWDTDGKIYATGYRESDQQAMLLAYQFK